MTGDPRLLKGFGVSPGCAIGPAYVIQWGLPVVSQRVVPEADAAGEVERLHTALGEVRDHLRGLRRRAEERVGPEEAKIFDVHLMMLEDQEFISAVEHLIRENRFSAGRAFEFKMLELRALWAQSDSAVLQQRRADLFGIGVRVLQQLTGHSIDDVLQQHEGRPVIVLTRELTPGLTVEFDRDIVAGFASVEGTRTSHAAILAHSMGIPCVMGCGADLEHVKPGGEVILDGTLGTILLDPTDAEIHERLEEERRRRAFIREVERDEQELARSLDGVHIAVRGNVDLPEELNESVSHRAEGVGLLRTEFLVIGRTELPSEDEQAHYFERVVKRFPGEPVVVRSYDLGGDKYPAGFRPPREANPFLGWRAIRVCLDRPEIFRPQLRAMMRARVHGDVQLMLPLVTQVEEVMRVRELVEAEVASLEKDGVPHRSDLPVGIMIETPAAVLLAEDLVRHADFLSVGTNDLTQYTLVVDRGNARLASRYTPYHPAVVRFLKRIVDVAEEAGLPVSVCGEMASEPLATFLLIGMGYSVFSVAPPRLGFVRWLVKQIDAGAARQLAAGLTQTRTIQEVIDILTRGLSGFVDLNMLSTERLPSAEAQTSFKD
jgi:phosphotransferase system enzyme I (PtsI)